MHPKISQSDKKEKFSICYLLHIECHIFGDSCCTGLLVRNIDKLRYPKLKLWFYFKECHVGFCTHFAILNYDDQITIV